MPHNPLSQLMSLLEFCLQFEWTVSPKMRYGLFFCEGGMVLQVLERRPRGASAADSSAGRDDQSGTIAPGAIVLLHGWGANAQDLMDLAPALAMPDHWLFFPNAPIPHPYSPQGRMWYDLESPDFQGLAQSRQLLLDWLQTLPSLTGLPPERIILGGFSQGGAMTLELGLTLPPTLNLGGLLVLSGYLHPQLQTLTLDGTALPPIQVIHGRQDTVVPIAAARQIQSVILRKGGQVQYQEFDMGHEINPAALAIAHNFLLQTLPSLEADR